jgi:uncharacterized protein YukE
MEHLNIIIGLANACGIIIIIYRIGRWTGQIETMVSNLDERLKKVEDRWEGLLIDK